MKKLVMILGVIAIMLLAGCTDIPQEDPMAPAHGDEPVQQDPMAPTPQEPQLDLPDVVATINGDEITSEEVLELQMQMQMQGMELSVEEVVNQLLTNKVLINEASNKGYVVTSEEVEQNFVQQGFSVEELREMVQMQGMDYDQFIEDQKANFKFMLLIEEVKEDITVTEEEARQVYDMQSAMIEESYEEIADDLKRFIAEEKANEKLMNLATTLIQESDVEVFY